MITYKEDEKIANEDLYSLFQSVGWIKPFSEKHEKDDLSDCIANHTLYLHENDPEKSLEKTFNNSTYVVSAWDEDKFVGVIRVLSDKVQRSILYDLAVLSNYQKQGIGKELVQKCLKKFPKTQFTLGTSSKNFEFYKKFGFQISHNYLEIESKFF